MAMQRIIAATLDDIPELVILLERSYRGEQGWTRDGHLFSEGTRVTPALLQADMEKPGSAFWKCVDNNGKIIGCVFTEKEEDKMYTGMLCVHPEHQEMGLGKTLMGAAEEEARKQGCTAVKILAISRRTELVEWYERRGFTKTGNTEPFPTPYFGIPKVPLELVEMQKGL